MSTWGEKFPLIDTDLDALITMDIEHWLAHQGKMYLVTHLFTAVADDASVYVLIKVGSTQTLHLSFGVRVGGAAYVYGRKSPDLSANGTALTAGALKDGSGAGIDSTFFHTPTVNGGDYGTQMYVSLVGSGSRPNDSGGGSLRPGLEWELSKDTNYVLQVTNKAGSAQDIAIEMSVYND